jgi:toxin FitB
VSGFLIDTNVLSEFSRRGEPNPKVKTWLKAAVPGSLYVSILTLAELRRGIELLPPSKRRDQLEQWLEYELIQSFDQANVLPVTKAIGTAGLLYRRVRSKRASSSGYWTV